METFKKFIIGLLSTLLVIFLSFITLFTYSKNLIEGPFLTETIKKAIAQEAPNKEEELTTQMIDINNLDGVDDIVNSFVDDYINGRTSDHTIDVIIDFIKKNKDVITQLPGDEIKVEEMDSYQSREELRRNLDNAITEINSCNSVLPVDSIISIYSKITKYATIKNAYIVSTIVAILIIILSSSYYKWLKTFSRVFISLGVMTLAIFMLSLVLINIIKSIVNVNIGDYQLLIIGIIEIIIGIILSSLYKYNDKRDKEMNNTNNENNMI